MRPNVQPLSPAGKEGASSLTNRFGNRELIAGCGGFASSQIYLHYSSSFRILLPSLILGLLAEAAGL